MYKVINRFKETHHNDHIYEVGDDYPVKGKKLVEKRADFLTNIHPTYKMAFLEKLEEETPKKKPIKKKSDG